MFNHIPINTPLIESAYESNKHFYSINGEKFPSITTILHSFPKIGIDIWKAKTPNWKDIQEESFKVGTNLHKNIEDYLNNSWCDAVRDLKSIDLFENLKPELDKINNIQCLETYLYEPNLKIAGCTDCVAEYEGEKCIIDFKSARRKKLERYVKSSGYYLQLTGYAKMFEFCTGQKIDNGVIMIADFEGGVNIHKIKIKDYEEDLEALIELYYNSENNR